MEQVGVSEMDWPSLAAKFFGSAFGVLLSMLFVAPANNRNALYRILFAPIAGVIFAPSMQGVFWFLQGSTLEHLMAAGCATGFCVWFVLEVVARMLSRQDTLQRLLEELLTLRGDGKK